MLNKMKAAFKTNSLLICKIILIVLVATISISGVFLYKTSTFQQVEKILFSISGGLYTVVTSLFCVYIVFYLLREIKQGYQGLNQYKGLDNHIFSAIDQYKAAREISQHYSICIKRIDELYKDKEVEKYIQTNNLKFFSNRKNYLEKHMNKYNDGYMIFRDVLFSFSLAFLSGVIYRNTLHVEDIALIIFWILTIFCAVLFPYIKLNYGEDILKEIDKYEIGKIDQFINQILNKLETEKEPSLEEIAFETKYNLYGYAKCNKQKREFKKILKWNLITEDILKDKTCYALYATISTENKEMKIGFIVDKLKYMQYSDENGSIDKEKITTCLISKDYVSCFEYVEKNFGENICFHNGEIK